ncbi:hypothetical protein BLOT_004573 [Blomia tropicalis]|nr:hypothetical protein BLOT_004573 [Blomia tropicalis]
MYLMAVMSLFYHLLECSRIGKMWSLGTIDALIVQLMHICRCLIVMSICDFNHILLLESNVSVNYK